MDWENKLGFTLLHGREDLWTGVIASMSSKDYFISYGVNAGYWHNCSIELIRSWGWGGLIIFYSSIVYMLEKLYLPNSKYNIFLLAFCSFIAQNTFENYLASSGFLLTFQYALLGVVWRHRSSILELDHTASYIDI